MSKGGVLLPGAPKLVSKFRKDIVIRLLSERMYHEKNGAGKGGRTLDLLVGNETLYH